MKKFNTTAVCIPQEHYMVNLRDRVREIRRLVDEGKYYTINRARQYGKTTTIDALETELSSEYYVLSLDFQRFSDASFNTEENYVRAFCRHLIKRKSKACIPDSIIDALQELVDRRKRQAFLDELFSVLGKWCRISDKPVVMIIDEVDTATNNQVFLDFLAQLRANYLEEKKDPEEKTFQSVILGG